MRGDPLAESYTHADGVIGHFDIGRSGAGDLALRPQGTHFVVTEAKLHSKLSSGTKNAPGFDQAARNVACMAHILSAYARRPEDMASLAFFVVAPNSQISAGMFDQQVNRRSIRDKVARRVQAYDDQPKQAWFEEWFLPTLDRTRLASISWEELGEFIQQVEPSSGGLFSEFYSRCLEYNRLPGSEVRAKRLHADGPPPSEAEVALNLGWGGVRW